MDKLGQGGGRGGQKMPFSTGRPFWMPPLHNSLYYEDWYLKFHFRVIFSWLWLYFLSDAVGLYIFLYTTLTILRLMWGCQRWRTPCVLLSAKMLWCRLIGREKLSNLLRGCPLFLKVDIKTDTTLFSCIKWANRSTRSLVSFRPSMGSIATRGQHSF